MAYFGSNYWRANYHREDYWAEGVAPGLTQDPAAPDASISYFNNQFFNLQYMSPAYWPGQTNAPPPSSMCLSTVYEEQNIDVVCLALKHRKTGQNLTIYLGREFFDADELYNGSPVVYPLLSESPRWQRGIGTELAIRYDVQIKIYGNTPLFVNGKSFHSLREDYFFQNASVRGLYFSKASGGLSSPIGTNTRQTLTIRDAQWSDDGILSLSARDTWFDENKQLADRLTPETFPNIEQERRFEYGNWAFGRFIVVDAARINVGQQQNGFKYYLGHEVPDNQIQEINHLYARNTSTDLDSRSWLQIDKNPPAPFSGPLQGTIGGITGSSYFSLRDFSRAVLITPSEPTVVSSVTITLRAEGFLPTSTSHVKLSIYRADYDAVADIWRASGSALAEANFENEYLTDNVPLAKTEYLSNVLVLSDQITYIGILEWVDREENREPGRLDTTGATAVNDVFLESSGNFYFSANGQIKVYYPASDETETIISLNRGLDEGEVATPEAVRTLNNLVYWVDSTQGKLQRCDLMGENLVDLQTGLQEPLGMDIGIPEGRLYWTERVSGSLKSCLLDGTGIVTLQAGLITPRGLKVDDATGQIIFCAGTQLMRCNKDGSGLTALESNLGAPWGVALDPTTQTAYFSDFDRETIYRKSYNGSAVPLEKVFSRINKPKGVAVDTALQGAYWANPIENRIQTAPMVEQFEVLVGVIAKPSIVHFAREESTRDALWSKQLDLEPAITINAMGLAPMLHETVNGESYAAFTFSDQRTTGSPGDWPDNLDLNLKAEINAVGGASLVDPARFIRFLLEDETFGLGLPSSAIATGLFNSVAAKVSAELGFRIDRQTEARTLIQRICRLYRIIFYKLRDGQLAVHYPEPYRNDRAEVANSGFWQDEMVVEQVEDNAYTQIINSFENAYFEDFLDQPADESFQRRARGERFQSLIYLDGDTSNNADTVRENKMAFSQQLFGKKPFREDFELIQRQVDALTIRNYLADRWATLQRRALVRMPRREWYTRADLFSNIRLFHRDIPVGGGQTDDFILHSDFENFDLFFDGVRLNLWCGGEFQGEVVETYEQDDYVYFMLETVAPF